MPSSTLAKVKRLKKMKAERAARKAARNVVQDQVVVSIPCKIDDTPCEFTAGNAIIKMYAVDIKQGGDAT